MIRASVYGRLGADPIARQTKNGKAMVTCSFAVNAARPGTEEITEWFSLAAFGKTAEALERHFKGDLLAASGELHKTKFVGRDGKERESWALTVAHIVSARVVRPGGTRKRAENAMPAREST